MLWRINKRGEGNDHKQDTEVSATNLFFNNILSTCSILAARSRVCGLVESLQYLLLISWAASLCFFTICSWSAELVVKGCTFCTGCTLQSTGSQLTRGIMCSGVGWCHSDHPKIVLWTVKRIKAEITSAVAGRFHQTDQHNSGGFDAKACGLLLSCLVMYF